MQAAPSGEAPILTKNVSRSYCGSSGAPSTTKLRKAATRGSCWPRPLAPAPPSSIGGRSRHGHRPAVASRCASAPVRAGRSIDWRCRSDHEPSRSKTSGSGATVDPLRPVCSSNRTNGPAIHFPSRLLHRHNKPLQSNQLQPFRPIFKTFSTIYRISQPFCAFFSKIKT